MGPSAASGAGGTANVPGTGALPIYVDVGTASLDNLTVTLGEMSTSTRRPATYALFKIASAAGDVRVEVPGGNLVDANNISVPDVQNLTLLEARWNSMLATGSTAQVSINNTINAYESQIDQEYQTYWQFRDEQADPSVFDPNFQVTLPAAQLSAWTAFYTTQGTSMGLSGSYVTDFVNNAIQTLENTDTQEYRTLNATFGKLGNTFDPNYRYYANQTPLNMGTPLSFGASAIDATGFWITLPGNGFSSSTPVLYAPNGGSVSGLTSGGTYYAIPDPIDPNQISLASSYANATAAVPVEIHIYFRQRHQQHPDRNLRQPRRPLQAPRTSTRRVT